MASSRPLRSGTDRSARLIVLRVCLVVCRLVCLSVCACMFVCRSVGRTVGRPVCRPVCLYIGLSVSLSVCLSVSWSLFCMSVGVWSAALAGRAGASLGRLPTAGRACAACACARARVCLYCRSHAQALGDLQVSHSVLCWGAGGAQRVLSIVGKHRRGWGHIDYAYSCFRWCMSVSSPHAPVERIARKRAVA